MDDEIANGVELHSAGNAAHFLAVYVEIDEGGGKAAGAYLREEFLVGEGQKLRLLLVAINDAGDETFTTHCPSGPLASSAARRGLQFNGFGHGRYLLEEDHEIQTEPV